MKIFDLFIGSFTEKTNSSIGIILGWHELVKATKKSTLVKETL
jgi:hypothetical protein